MSSAQRVDSTDDYRPEIAGGDETARLTTSVMNRTHWMQRVLSPWVQRWLSSGVAGEAADQASGRPAFTSLTSASTQRTLARLRVQYESHSNLETLATSGSLPLAGSVENSAPAVESAAPATPRRRAQGPYSKPFTSVDDFIHALEAAKERNYAPPPPETQPRPAPKREAGPYSKPFHSMEEFVQAVNAAKERDYAPPSELQPQPAPKREVGPYSKAFASFDDFVKAVAETKEQWGQATTASSVQTAEAQVQSDAQPSKPARVRPVSRVEELPARAETRAVSSAVELSALPEISRPAPQPKSVPAAKPASAQTQPKSMPSVAPQPAAAPASPQVQRSPLEAPADPSVLEEEVKPDVQRSVAPALQRMEASPRPEPAAQTVSASAEPTVTPEPDQMVQRLSQPVVPQVNRPVEMPLVQRHTADSEAPDEITSAEEAPLETDQPVVQRQVANVQRQPEVNFTTPPVEIEEPVASPEEPIVQRQTASPVQPKPAATPIVRPDMPLVQRQAAAEALEPEEPEEQAASVVQRKVAEIQRQPEANFTASPTEIEEPAASAEEPIVQRQTASPVQPKPTATPIVRPDMPLVQRQAAADALEPEEPEEQAAPVVQRQVAETQSVAPEIPATRPTARPSVEQPQSPRATLQRRSAVTVPPPGDHAVTPSAELPPSQATQLPLVQRQPAMFESTQAVEPLVEAPVDWPEVSRPSAAPLQTESQTETRPASVDMPLVQRQKNDAASASLPSLVQRHAAEPPESADELDTVEGAVQRSVDLSVPALVPVRPPATPDKPLVQRQPSAPTSEAPHRPQAVQSGEKRIVVPLADAKSPAAHVEMPLVQRQAAETELEPADLNAAETMPLEDAATDATLQRKSTTAKTLLRKAVASVMKKPAAPSVQRHTAVSIEPAGEQDLPLPPAQMDTRASLEMPFVQRQPLEGKPAATPSQPTVVQRSAAAGEPEVEAAASQPAFDLSERILSRVAPPERRAAVKPADLPLHHTVVQRESQPEAMVSNRAAQSERSTTPFASAPAVMGAAPAIQRTAEPLIQRIAAESETSSPGTGYIQRVESVPAAAEQEAEAAEPVDLDNLARQVYPLIKRMIAVERERRAFR
ncbi:hypothetical protein TFLX_02994 [Thermoflexales bacterium]|nr:hypothetical protein TFLX_02994 [Thermoflexales bacterium]